MIHVAPCSCELHVRIRELEAERETFQLMIRGRDVNIGQWKARAEKAEHDLATLTVQNDTAAALLRQSQARVAELERMEEFWHNLAALNVRPELIERYLKNPNLLLPPDMREAREREAD